MNEKAEDSADVREKVVDSKTLLNMLIAKIGNKVSRPDDEVAYEKILDFRKKNLETLSRIILGHGPIFAIQDLTQDELRELMTIPVRPNTAWIALQDAVKNLPVAQDFDSLTETMPIRKPADGTTPLSAEVPEQN